MPSSPLVFTSNQVAQAQGSRSAHRPRGGEEEGLDDQQASSGRGSLEQTWITGSALLAIVLSGGSQ